MYGWGETKGCQPWQLPGPKLKCFPFLAAFKAVSYDTSPPLAENVLASNAATATCVYTGSGRSYGPSSYILKPWSQGSQRQQALSSHEAFQSTSFGPTGMERNIYIILKRSGQSVSLSVRHGFRVGFNRVGMPFRVLEQ
jgi:hypothetical protein